eukprot:1033390-Rhodomonas_salina.1
MPTDFPDVRLCSAAGIQHVSEPWARPVRGSPAIPLGPSPGLPVPLRPESFQHAPALDREHDLAETETQLQAWWPRTLNTFRSGDSQGSAQSFGSGRIVECYETPVASQVTLMCRESIMIVGKRKSQSRPRGSKLSAAVLPRTGFSETGVILGVYGEYCSGFQRGHLGESCALATGDGERIQADAEHRRVRPRAN